MLQLKNIVKDYVAGDTTVKALKGINIDFRQSEFVSILGPSGCGKTTLLNIVGGLDRYTSGDLIINGKSTKDFKDSDWDTYRNHKIGFVFQSYNLIAHLSVVANVELALSLSGVNRKERRERALAALKEVGLKDQANKKPNQLSGGQMQRVAIARALVNDPDIILADEPTGALDSKTSVQVMNILKRISENKLIIMVTHNADIAEEYSNRIITMMDGNITNDNNPFNLTEFEQKEIERLEVEHELGDVEFAVENTEKKQPKKKRKPLFKRSNSAMGYGTALSISGKNLLSKKGRTLMTSFAGSIGIIGVALVLAISNGFTGYINAMQNNALGSSPMAVSSISVNTDKLNSVNMDDFTNNEDYSDENFIMPYNPTQQLTQYGHYNAFTSDFMDKIKKFEEDDKKKGDNRNFNTIEYNYYTPLKLVYKLDDNTPNNTADDLYNYFENKNQVNIMSAVSNPMFYPLLNNQDYILSQYDLIYGDLPKVDNAKGYSTDVVLVIDKGNKLTYTTLKSLGFNTVSNDQNATFNPIKFEDVVGKEYKVVYNDDYYKPDSDNFDEITSFKTVKTTEQSVRKELYNNATETLRICGVLRQKDDSTSALLTSGIAFHPTFKDHYLQNCRNSVIARKQLAVKDDYTFFVPYTLNIQPFSNFGPFNSVNEINQLLYVTFKYTLTNDDAFDLAMQQIGISNIPISIIFYPKSFDAKESVLEFIDNYNSGLTNKNQEILYFDTSEFLTNTLGQLINMISYVLVAFASISLVVSSVMIGVLTYASVIERTKEIGVLRSIGARKKDISRVFNSETLIIGFGAGLIGILISYILCPIISAIIKAVAGGAVTTSLAILNPLHALILVVISTLLTLISGLIPSRVAAKKDPVKALRSE